MQATGAQPCRLAAGAQLHYERHRPEHSTLYRLVQQHGASLFEQAERAAGAELPPFVKDAFDAKQPERAQAPKLRPSMPFSTHSYAPSYAATLRASWIEILCISQVDAIQG